MKLFFALAASVLAGCASLLPERDSPAAVDSVVAEALSAARAPASEQKAVLARAQQAYEREGSALGGLRLAALLASLPAPLRDDARAQELLQPLADAAAPGIGRFAALLLAQIGERQRILHDAERQARERERTDKAREKREEALRLQLEALSSIERGILDREERLRRRPR